MRPTTCSSSIILPRKPQQKECCIQKKRRVLLPATVTLCVNQIVINADNKKQQAFRRTPAAFKYFRIIQHILSQKTHYSHSTGLNWFRLGNIVRPVRSSSDYLIYPYYPACHPSCYHFVISVDNREGELLRIIALLLYQNTTQFQDALRKYDYLWETVNSE